MPRRRTRSPRSTSCWRALRARWGACYACGMGVGGMVLVRLSSTLSDAARSMGTTETALSGVFLARGAGALLGAAVSARACSSPAAAPVTARSRARSCSSRCSWRRPRFRARAPVLLYAAWFCAGASAAALDTGCQIMTRKVRGALAGPWLGLNTVCFRARGRARAAARNDDARRPRDPVPDPRRSVRAERRLRRLGAAPRGSCVRARARAPRAKPDRAAGGGGGEHRWAEIALSCSVFCLIGTIVDLTTYIQTYVKASGVTTTGRAPDALLVVWVSITLGRLVGLGDQWRLRRHGDGRVYAHAASSLATGALGDGTARRVGRADEQQDVLGWSCPVRFGKRAVHRLRYELLNQLTVASDEGMSIMNVGPQPPEPSLVPYITSIWASTALSYHAIIWIRSVSAVALPLPFMAAARGSPRRTRRRRRPWCVIRAAIDFFLKF